MANRGDLQTPYSDAIMPTPSGAADGGGTSGGFDFPDGRKESPNAVSGLAALPTTVNPTDNLGGASPGIGDVIGMPPVEGLGTIPSKGIGTD